MAHPRFKIFETIDGQYAFNLTASNAEIVVSSERYVSHLSAQEGVTSTRLNAPLDQRYDRRRASDGQYYFVLRGGNYEVLGTSELYTTATAREDGIESVKKNAPVAPVED